LKGGEILTLTLTPIYPTCYPPGSPYPVPIPIHLGGSGPLGSRREAAKGANPQLKRPAEAMDITPGIDAHSKNNRGQRRPPTRKTWVPEESVRRHSATHLLPLFPLSYSTTELIRFRFKAHQEGAASSWALQSRDIATRTLQRSRLVAVTPVSHCHHTRPRNARTGALAEETQCTAANR